MSDFKFLTAELIYEIFSRFREENPFPTTELIAPNDYTLLVAVVLSAQATDKSVNKATEKLFQTVKTPHQMLELGYDNLIEYIKSIGLYRAKARYIMELSRQLIERFDSKLPATREELESLSGVGRKTANVILNVVFHQKTMPVDTHLLRIAPRIGLSCGTSPVEVEKDLLSVIPQEFMEHAHHWLILHGRYVCTARKPDCPKCLICDICAKNNLIKTVEMVKNKNKEEK
ncbi:MAG: endonuclease III [Treponemataceae bacterium]